MDHGRGGSLRGLDLASGSALVRLQLDVSALPEGFQGGSLVLKIEWGTGNRIACGENGYMIGNRVYFLNVVSAETFGFSVLSVYLEYDGAATSSFRHVLEEDRRYLRERPAHLGTSPKVRKSTHRH